MISTCMSKFHYNDLMDVVPTIGALGRALARQTSVATSPQLHLRRACRSTAQQACLPEVLVQLAWLQGLRTGLLPEPARRRRCIQTRSILHCQTLAIQHHVVKGTIYTAFAVDDVWSGSITVWRDARISLYTRHTGTAMMDTSRSCKICFTRGKRDVYDLHSTLLRMKSDLCRKAQWQHAPHLGQPSLRVSANKK